MSGGEGAGHGKGRLGSASRRSRPLSRATQHRGYAMAGAPGRRPARPAWDVGPVRAPRRPRGDRVAHRSPHGRARRVRRPVGVGPPGPGPARLARAPGRRARTRRGPAGRRGRGHVPPRVRPLPRDRRGRRSPAAGGPRGGHGPRLQVRDDQGRQGPDAPPVPRRDARGVRPAGTGTRQT